jgi:hypothetical protein
MLESSREIWLFPKNNCRNLATGKPNKKHTHTHTHILLAILKFFFQATGKFRQEKKHKKKKKKTRKALLLHHQHHDHDHDVIIMSAADASCISHFFSFFSISQSLSLNFVDNFVVGGVGGVGVDGAVRSCN